MLVDTASLYYRAFRPTALVREVTRPVTSRSSAVRAPLTSI
ncbi:hypothetical protein KEM60_00537 [Austwickia sp. TVS 96-490-7B]|nr:hypothetical protein [Austwickia sp. TVS 96-490-7B]